jgi:membrane-associated protein
MGIKPALFWFSVVGTLALLWNVLDLPAETEMVTIVSSWLGMYGLYLVLIGSFIEALLFIGIYFPGSIVIFLSVALAPDSTSAMVTVLCISLGMFFGYLTNYLMGKYGWYKLFLKLGMKNGINRAQMKMQTNDIRYVFYTYWNPGLAAFTATAAGILKMSGKRFVVLSISGILLWNTFWGVLVYSLGESALVLLNFSIVLKIAAVWIVFELVMLLWRKYHSMQK